MSKVFYFGEILKFAVEKELESIELYSNLAKQTSDPKAKALFEKLVNEENKHETFYALMLKSVEQEKVPFMHDDEEYDAYMKELINSSRTVPKIASDVALDKILDYAIAREKDSVVFYAGLRNYIPSIIEPQINDIIKEETQHAILLLNFKKNLQ